MDRPAYLYKYTSYQGAKATIANCSLKLSIAAAFNDPFDILLEEALGSEVQEFLENLMPAFFDFVAGEINHSSLRHGSMRDVIIAINTRLRLLRPGELAEIREEYMSKPAREVWDVTYLRQSNDAVVSMIRNMLSTYGIFCSTTNKDSLLMWSHYADHHRGVVFELQPDKEHDSVLLAFRPVRYTEQRPLLYYSPQDMLSKSFLMDREESAKQMLESLIYTKSTEWKYEEEYRLAIPDFVPKGASERFLPLFARELSHIYFGCRLPDDQRAELKVLAKALNPDVRFSRAVMAKRRYGLEWVEDPA